jgi:hypothetical protein
VAYATLPHGSSNATASSLLVLKMVCAGPLRKDVVFVTVTGWHLSSLAYHGQPDSPGTPYQGDC